MIWMLSSLTRTASPQRATAPASQARRVFPSVRIGSCPVTRLTWSQPRRLLLPAGDDLRDSPARDFVQVNDLVLPWIHQVLIVGQFGEPFRAQQPRLLHFED